MNVVVHYVLYNIIKGIVETAAVSPFRGSFSTTIRIDYQPTEGATIRQFSRSENRYHMHVISSVISADTESPLLCNGTQ